MSLPAEKKRTTTGPVLQNVLSPHAHGYSTKLKFDQKIWNSKPLSWFVFGRFKSLWHSLFVFRTYISYVFDQVCFLYFLGIVETYSVNRWKPTLRAREIGPVPRPGPVFLPSRLVKWRELEHSKKIENSGDLLKWDFDIVLFEFVFDLRLLISFDNPKIHWLSKGCTMESNPIRAFRQLTLTCRIRPPSSTKAPLGTWTNQIILLRR